MVSHYGLITVITRAVRKAAPRLRRDYNEVEQLQVSKKGPADFVSMADKRAEQTLVDELRNARPDWGMLLEEGGVIEGDPNKPRWIIDPLDGTTNFLHAFPQFAVSICCRHRDRAEAAVVFDPLHGELFTAARGDGAQLDGRRLRVSQRLGLDGALIGTGFPFRENKRWLKPYLAMLEQVMDRTAGVRRAGAASLDLAYVAAGRLDGFWEVGLAPWDTAAGNLLITESGGRVGTLAGNDYRDGGNVIVGNPRVYAALIELFAPYLDEDLRK
jgi:myo-inositol-1(or 4)-monophosphatase